MSATTYYWTANRELDRIVGEWPLDPLPDRGAVECPDGTGQVYARGDIVWDTATLAFVPAPVDVDADLVEAAAMQDRAAMTAAPDTVAQTITTVIYEVHRIQTAWGHAIAAEVLRGYSVVGQLALRVFDPWDGAIPFADVDGHLIATVVGVGSTNPLYPWEYGIWVEGIALDHKTMEPVDSESWLATRLVVGGAPIGGGSVPV